MYDRGFFDFTLIRRHLAASKSVPTPFVIRMRAEGQRSPKFDRGAARPHTAKDREAGVISDHGGRLAGSEHGEPPEAVLPEYLREPDAKPQQ